MSLSSEATEPRCCGGHCPVAESDVDKRDTASPVGMSRLSQGRTALNWPHLLSWQDFWGTSGPGEDMQSSGSPPVCLHSLHNYARGILTQKKPCLRPYQLPREFQITAPERLSHTGDSGSSHPERLAVRLVLLISQTTGAAFGARSRHQEPLMIL